MRLARPRFTVRRMMVGVAVVAFAAAVGVQFWKQCLVMGAPVTLAFVSAIAGAFGVASLRHPWISLGVLIWICAAAPSVHHMTVVHLAGAIVVSAWFIGAPTGWIVRAVHQPETPEPPVDAITNSLTEQ